VNELVLEELHQISNQGFTWLDTDEKSFTELNILTSSGTEKEKYEARKLQICLMQLKVVICGSPDPDPTPRKMHTPTFTRLPTREIYFW
jgi:hypothetical protein